MSEQFNMSEYTFRKIPPPPPPVVTPYKGTNLDPRGIVIFLVILTWMMIDGYVIFQEEDDFYEYLTNWVWMIGGVVRLVMLVSRAFGWCSQTGVKEEAGWVNTWWVQRNYMAASWVALGVAQVAVMTTFFVVLLVDSAVVEYHLNKPDPARCDQVIGWNHIRHVSPVLFHFALTLCDGVWYTEEIRGEPGKDYSTTPEALILGVGVPLVGSVVYMLAADEQEVYHWRHSMTGVYAGITFGLSCVFGGFIYLAFVPSVMRAVVPNPPAKAIPGLAPVAPSVDRGTGRFRAVP